MQRKHTRLVTALLLFALILAVPIAQAEASKALKFVPTAVYFDDNQRLTLVGEFHNTGTEYVSGVQNFIPVVYLDDEMEAADTFAFQVNVAPGYYREVVMKLNARYRSFSKWFVKWDSYTAY